MKAIELLKDYKNIDFGCNMEGLHNEIDEAIEELEAYITNYQGIKRRLDNTVTALTVLEHQNKSLVKTLEKYNKEMIELIKQN